LIKKDETREQLTGFLRFEVLNGGSQFMAHARFGCSVWGHSGD